ncbi:nuclear transport factor 2 family protein [Actinoallomurus sp. NPDC052308]|uniref:nuclear transport factor 2 family protein n=1 Tax=Actinoallomurus sp. NPDC052308 TaxID=3155530 RepID=UPI00341FF7AD
MSSTHAELVHRLIDAINDTDPVGRRATIQEIFTPDCAYTDPDDAVEGHDALDALFARLQSQAPPGFRFDLAAPVNAHHQQARFAWKYGPLDAPTPVATGSDVTTFRDGRIHRVYAFFDNRSA